MDTLISAIITSGITSDKTFINWRKEASAAAQIAKAATEEKSARQTINNNPLEDNVSVKTLFSTQTSNEAAKRAS